MATLEQLEKEITTIKQRNAKVEIDKRWETSLTRRALLFLFTYLAIAIYMYAIDVINPWLNAVIPSIGFLLSTLTLPFFKSLWVKYYLTKRQ